MITEISSFINKYRWTIISLVIITFLGALIRYYGSFVEPYAIYFHLDDSGHIWRSGFNFTDGISTNLPEIFFNSYKDAHPPLRNLFLNIIFRFIDDVYFVRLVSFIPGVLLIPISFFYGYYLFDGQEKQINLKIGLLVSTIVSFSHPFNFFFLCQQDLIP